MFIIYKEKNNHINICINFEKNSLQHFKRIYR